MTGGLSGEVQWAGCFRQSEQNKQEPGSALWLKPHCRPCAAFDKLSAKGRAGHNGTQDCTDKIEAQREGRRCPRPHGWLLVVISRRALHRLPRAQSSPAMPAISCLHECQQHGWALPVKKTQIQVSAVTRNQPFTSLSCNDFTYKTGKIRWF